MKTNQKPHRFLFILPFIFLILGQATGQALQPFLPASNPQGAIELPTVMGNKLFFVCTSPTTGKELWVTDGTPEGCQLVKDIFTSTGSSNPHDLMVVGNVLFFWANDGVNGDKLWMTDGTEPGTKLVTDQSPNGYATTPNKRKVGGRLIISTTAGTGLQYLFSVDQQGMVTKLSPVAQGNTPLVDFNNRLLFFQKNDSVFLFNESFTSKTLLKTGLRMYFPSNEPIGCILGNKYVFTGSQGNTNFEPWVTDGTPAGTMMLSDIAPSSSSLTSAYYVFNGKAYFTVNTGPVGSELYATDGTTGGTYLVKNINLQNNGVTGSSPHSFTAVGDSLYFLANDGFFGEELYVTTGTEASTRRLTDLRLGTSSGNISQMTSFQGRLYFQTSYDTLQERKNGLLTKFRVANANIGGLYVVGDALLFSINYGLARIFPDLSIGRYTNNSVNFTNNYFSFANRIFGTHTANKMFSILESDLVSVVPVWAASPLTVYPNPVKDRLYIRKDPSFQPLRFLITDVLGKDILETGAWDSRPELNVSGLSPGVYWVRMVGQDAVHTIKFVKE